VSINAINLAVSQFSTNVEVLLQQKGSTLRPKVTIKGDCRGKQAVMIDQVGPVEAQTPAGRFAPIGRVDAAVRRPWVFPIDKDLPQMFDTFDKLRLISDPQSVYVENAAYAFGRAWDNEIVASAFRTAYIGETGTTTESFDTAYSIAADFDAAGEVGLTVSKLIEAKRLMRVAEVPDDEQKTLVIGPTQEADLLKQAQVTSSDFNKNGGVLNEGKVVRFMGFDIVVNNRLVLTSSDNRNLIAFAKSGLALGIWQDLMNDVTQRKDLSGLPWQLYSMATFGAVRTQNGKVVRIYADE
jgi:hypothetical protein